MASHILFWCGQGAALVYKVCLHSPVFRSAQFRFVDFDVSLRSVGARKYNKRLVAIPMDLANFNVQNPVAFDDHQCFRKWAISRCQNGA